MRRASIFTAVVFSAIGTFARSALQEGASAHNAALVNGQGVGVAELALDSDETVDSTSPEARRLATDINNLIGGSTSHQSTMDTGSWYNHMWDINGGYTIGVPIRIGTIHFRVGNGNSLTGMLRLGYYSSQTALVAGYLETTFSVAYTTINGVSDNFVIGNFNQAFIIPSQTMWAQIWILSGSNSRNDIGPATYTSTYYQTGSQRSGYASFNLAYSPGGCDPGLYMSGSFVCTACAAGSYSSTSQNMATSCTSCSAGSFAAASGATSCTNCGPGRYQGSTGQTSCAPCEVGAYSAGGVVTACTKCAAGTSQPSTGSSVCVACTNGQYQDSTGAAACAHCEVGAYSAGGVVTACTKCAAGTSQPSTMSSVCVACPGGQYQDSTGAAACVSCASGKYQSVSSSTSCSTCPAGQFQTMTGQTSCLSTPSPTPQPTLDTQPPSVVPTPMPTMRHVTVVNKHRVSSPVIRTELLILNGVPIRELVDGGRRLASDDDELASMKLLVAELAAVVKAQQVAINEMKMSIAAEFDARCPIRMMQNEED